MARRITSPLATSVNLNPPSAPPRKRPALERTTLVTSRLLDFASEKELTAQTGHAPGAWPLVVLKETVDNALDACEDQDIAPVITVTVDAFGITVADNGPGLPAETLNHVLDFTVRVSSREAYVSPTRGAQGNALKTILAMPFVLDGSQGTVVITAHGLQHTITVGVDRIRQEPVITLDQEPSPVKNGTVVRVCWPDSPSSSLDGVRGAFLRMAQGYAWLNAHLTITVDWFGERWTARATDPAWRKWKANDPTSPHWYTVETLERLIAGYIAHDERKGGSRTVRDVVAEFKGLSGSAKLKTVLEATGLARSPLSGLVNKGTIDRAAVAGLLGVMRDQSAPVQPMLLGPLGKDNLAACFDSVGSEMDSFRYRRVVGGEGRVPWIVEAAFCWCPSASSRSLITGVNWSPGIVNPFREIGRFGLSLDTILQRQRVAADDPVVLVIHLICPHVSYTDRGKSAVVVPDGEQTVAIIAAVETVTKPWATQRKAEERERSAYLNRATRLARRKTVSLKDAAWQVMEAAYQKASANGTLPANARQIMYAARPRIQELTGKQLDDKYFTQTLLPNYIEATGVDWDVIFDARGRLTEPHTDVAVLLGTKEVRDYLDDVGQHRVGKLGFDIAGIGYPTCGPKNGYGALLFIEKEGFTSLFDAVKLAERYDIAILSTKGMSVTAARELVQALCAEHGIPLLVLHDFDTSGFSISGTLSKSTRRFTFTKPFRVVDLGLRLADVHGLESEEVVISSPEKTTETLRRHGATEKEIAFLLQRRVELNAMTSDQLVAWIERKLEANGIGKVVPDEATLADAYRRMVRQAEVQTRIEEVLASLDQDETVPVPKGVRKQIKAALKEEPAVRWDQALNKIVRQDRGRS